MTIYDEDVKEAVEEIPESIETKPKKERSEAQKAAFEKAQAARFAKIQPKANNFDEMPGWFRKHLEEKEAKKQKLTQMKQENTNNAQNVQKPTEIRKTNPLYSQIFGR